MNAIDFSSCLFIEAGAGAPADAASTSAPEGGAATGGLFASLVARAILDGALESTVEAPEAGRDDAPGVMDFSMWLGMFAGTVVSQPGVSEAPPTHSNDGERTDAVTGAETVLEPPAAEADGRSLPAALALLPALTLPAAVPDAVVDTEVVEAPAPVDRATAGVTPAAEGVGPSGLHASTSPSVRQSVAARQPTSADSTPLVREDGFARRLVDLTTPGMSEAATPEAEVAAEVAAATTRPEAVGAPAITARPGDRAASVPERSAVQSTSVTGADASRVALPAMARLRDVQAVDQAVAGRIETAPAPRDGVVAAEPLEIAPVATPASSLAGRVPPGAIGVKPTASAKPDGAPAVPGSVAMGAVPAERPPVEVVTNRGASAMPLTETPETPAPLGGGASVQPVAVVPVPQRPLDGEVQVIRHGSAALAYLPATSADRENIETIVRSMQVQWNGLAGGEARLQLRPEHLGQVALTVRVEHGEVRAHVQAETVEASQWIEGHQEELRSSLREQGLEVKEFVVTTDPDDRRERSQPDPHSRRGRGRRAEPSNPDGPRFEVLV